MSKVKIEDYRSFEITFDTDVGKFTAWSNSFDNEFASTSFNAIKKGVDKYIKDNAEFRPFFIQKIFYYGRDISNIGEKIKVIGIRKDHKFVIEKNGLKEQLTDYDVKDYIVYNPENEPLRKQYLELGKEEREMLSKIKEKRKAILSKVTYTQTLSEKKKEILDQMQ